MVMDSEDVASAPSTPMTPGTPGAPLFGGFVPERSGNRRPSLLKSCKCFSVEAWAMEEGTLPSVFCSLPPPVSLARKVREFPKTIIAFCLFFIEILRPQIYTSIVTSHCIGNNTIMSWDLWVSRFQPYRGVLKCLCRSLNVSTTTRLFLKIRVICNFNYIVQLPWYWNRGTRYDTRSVIVYMHLYMYDHQRLKAYPF